MPPDMNVAHAKYFEARLISEARRIKKATLDNDVDSNRPTFAEIDRRWLDRSLEKFISMIAPILRVDDFVDESRIEKPFQQERPPREAGPMELPIFELEVSENGKRAIARQIGDKFVVEKNSAAAKDWHQKGSYPSYARLFDELVKQGVLKQDGDYRLFSRDYAFDSASAAASVVKGGPRTGPNAWRVRGQRKTLKQWENEQVEAVRASVSASN